MLNYVLRILLANCIRMYTLKYSTSEFFCLLDCLFYQGSKKASQNRVDMEFGSLISPLPALHVYSGGPTGDMRQILRARPCPKYPPCSFLVSAFLVGSNFNFFMRLCLYVLVLHVCAPCVELERADNAF